jgi:hypothetical protein
MSARQRRRKENRRRHQRQSRPRLIAAGGLTAGASLALSGLAQAAPMTFTVGSLADTTRATDCAHRAVPRPRDLQHEERQCRGRILS